MAARGHVQDPNDRRLRPIYGTGPAGLGEGGAPLFGGFRRFLGISDFCGSAAPSVVSQPAVGEQEENAARAPCWCFGVF